MMRVLILALLLGLSAALAEAGVIVALPQVSRPAGGEAQSLRADVQVTLTAPTAAFNSYGLAAWVKVAPQAGATGSLAITGGGAADAAPAFAGGDLQVAPHPGDPGVFAINAFANNAVSLGNGAGLFRLDLQAAAGSAGTWRLIWVNEPGTNESPALFDDSFGIRGDTTFSDGSVTLVPEPASLGLLLAGAALLLARRPRRRGSD